MHKFSKKTILTTLLSAFVLRVKATCTLSFFRLTAPTTIIPSIYNDSLTEVAFIKPWIYVYPLLLLSILILFLIIIFRSWKKNKILNEKMVQYIQLIYELQKPVELTKCPLEEIIKDENLSEAYRSKLQVAIWSASSMQETISSLMVQEKSDRFFQSMLNSNASKKVHLKEKVESKKTTNQQLKEMSKESGCDNSLSKDYLTDKLFLEKLMAILHKNMDDSNFTVDVLCEKIGMSRSSLYHKIKRISGQAPADFIRKFRLEKAKELLTSHQFTISEVAYKTGFSDVKYFRTIFKRHYKTNPGSFTKAQ